MGCDVSLGILDNALEVVKLFLELRLLHVQDSQPTPRLAHFYNPPALGDLNGGVHPRCIHCDGQNEGD